MINDNGDANDFIRFIKKNTFGLNVLLIQKSVILEKYPESFFTAVDSVYTAFSASQLHPYSSFSDFAYLVDLLGHSDAKIPSGVLELSSGSWLHDNGLEYAADFIKTTNDSFVYVVSNEPFEEVGFINSLGQGFLVGIAAIILFIILIYYYIRLRLRPIQLMKNRVLALEEGDLESKIEILGTDELAELSITFNKLISDIKNLIEQKHRVLLDVSHELKTPLTRMKLLLEMMPGNSKNTDLQTEINFLNDVISNLLLSDKLDIPYSTLDLVEVDFSSFVKKIVEDFDSLNNQKIVIKNVSISLKMLLDQTKIMIAIRNVLQNALKYGASDKGTLLSLSVQNNFAYISLKDFGPGIKEDDQKQLFTPFFRSKGTKHLSGIGLGLSITKKIMISHGGDVIFNTKIGSGTEFILSLPIKHD